MLGGRVNCRTHVLLVLLQELSFENAHYNFSHFLDASKTLIPFLFQMETLSGLLSKRRREGAPLSEQEKDSLRQDRLIDRFNRCTYI